MSTILDVAKTIHKVDNTESIVAKFNLIYQAWYDSDIDGDEAMEIIKATCIDEPTILSKSTENYTLKEMKEACSDAADCSGCKFREVCEKSGMPYDWNLNVKC